MNIILKKMKLENFKGIKSLEIDFNKETYIYGPNGSGKTSIFDAFTWLLFNKDSESKTFEVRTWDENNKVIEKLDHTAELTFEIDGRTVVLKKILKEKWTKRRGTNNVVFEGCMNEYYWNDVPQKEKEFNQKVNEIIDENLFKILTNPLEFNSINWKDRRAILFEIAGNLSDEEIIESSEELKELLNVIFDKSIEDYKKETSAKKTKLKKDFEEFRPRIDEVYKGIVEVSAPEFSKETINQEIDILNKKIDGINSSYKEIEEYNHKINAQILAFNSELHNKKLEYESSCFARENEINRQKNEVESKINILKLQKEQSENKLKEFEKNLETFKHDLENARNEALQIKQREFIFDEEKCVCPTCKRKYESEDIEKTKTELLENFNIQQSKDYEKIKNKGLSIKDYIEKHESEVQMLKEGVLKFDLENKELHSILLIFSDSKTEELIIFEDTEIFKELNSKIDNLKSNLKSGSNEELEAEKNNLITTRDELYKKFMEVKEYETIIENNKKLEDRITDLKKKETEVAELIADLEKAEFLIERFYATKINMTEEKINSLFTLTKFKMFKDHNNGSLEEMCSSMQGGVLWENLNTGMRINVGLDIINVLNDHYKTYLPIFIDNRESITNIIKTKSQIINLKVSETDESLRIA